MIPCMYSFGWLELAGMDMRQVASDMLLDRYRLDHISLGLRRVGRGMVAHVVSSVYCHTLPFDSIIRPNPHLYHQPSSWSTTVCQHCGRRDMLVLFRPLHRTAQVFLRTVHRTPARSPEGLTDDPVVINALMRYHALL